MTQPHRSPADPSPPPTLVVHDARQLRLAISVAERLQAPRLQLLSSEAAGCFLGPAWWLALMRIARDARGAGSPMLQDLLDCGDEAGRALEALRIGLRGLVLADTTQWRAVAHRAAPLGATLLAARPVALDLAMPGAERRIERWIADGSDAPTAG